MANALDFRVYLTDACIATTSTAYLAALVAENAPTVIIKWRGRVVYNASKQGGSMPRERIVNIVEIKIRDIQADLRAKFNEEQRRHGREEI